MTPEEFTDRAYALHVMNHPDEALVLVREGIDQHPDFAPLHHNHGLILSARGQPDLAIAAYRRAIAIDPGSQHTCYTHTNLGVVLCRLGCWREGYAEFEWRFRGCNILRHMRERFPYWDGQPLKGKRLLVYNEGGFGDLIYFFGLLPKLKDLGAFVMLVVHPDIFPLIHGQEGFDLLFPHIWEYKEDPGQFPPHDYVVSITSLSHIFELYPDCLPHAIPFIKLPRVHKMDSATKKVSITWAGSPIHAGDPQRSIPLSNFAVLGGIPGITLHAIQKGDLKRNWYGEDVNLGIMPADFEFVDLAPRLGNWLNTAYWLQQMDLVISCDTSVAHVAAAMGLKTWVLLPFIHDWRWPNKGDGTDWYPTVRFFRQSRDGDWTQTLAHVRSALEKWSAGACQN